MIVKDALTSFYKQYELMEDGGVDESSVKIVLFKGFSIYLPNINARKKAVLKHDIHHLLTGYSAVMKGEMEISAWELSSGCLNYWVAFVLNLYGMTTGVLFNLPGIWRAWVRGRNTNNLYSYNYSDEELLAKSVEELRNQLGLHRQPSANFLDFLSFVAFLIFGALFNLVSIVLLPLILIYSLYIIISKWKAH